VDLFASLRFKLFAAIVLAKLDREDFVRLQPDHCFPFLKVRLEDGATVEMALDLTAQKEGRMVWTAPDPSIDVASLDLSYVEHFAFDQFGADPLEYCRVRTGINNSPDDLQFLLQTRCLRYVGASS